MKIKDPFKRDFGHLSPKKRSAIRVILRKFMEDIRGVLARSERFACALRPALKTQCDTCAFNPETDNKRGFPGTSYGLLLMLSRREGVFCCHKGHDWENHEYDPEKAQLCRGFEAIRLFCGVEAVIVAFKAKEAINKVVASNKRSG